MVIFENETLVLMETPRVLYFKFYFLNFDGLCVPWLVATFFLILRKTFKMQTCSFLSGNDDDSICGADALQTK